MTKVFCFAALATSLFAFNAHSETVVQETLIHETTTTTFIETSPDTVICSAADYSLPQLKILIPELAALTLLDHQNTGAGAPCVAAGPCFTDGVPTPEEVLSTLWSWNLVEIRVSAIRVDTVDHDNETCSVQLKETVNLTLGQTPFYHEELANLGTRPYLDCLTTSLPDFGSDDEYSYGENASDSEAPLGSDEPSYPVAPYDQDDSANEVPAGCSTSGVPGGAMFVLMGLLGWIWARKRSLSKV